MEILSLLASLAVLSASPQSPCGWSAVPGAPAGSVRALHSRGGALYVGGDLPQVGNVARWDGLTWSTLGNGTNGPVHGFAEFDAGAGAMLIVYGAFDHVGDRSTPGVALWDGAQWIALPGSLGVQPLAAAQGGTGADARVVVGGHSPWPSSQALWWWDGSDWRGEPSFSEVILDLEPFDGRLHAAALFGIESWIFGADGPTQHHFDSSGLFMPQHLAIAMNGGEPRLHALGDGFFPTPPFAPPVPAGNAIRHLAGSQWTDTYPNVGASAFGLPHSARHLVQFDAPSGPSWLVMGQFTHQHYSFIELPGQAYKERAHLGPWGESDVLLPLTTRLDAVPAALASHDFGAGARVFAGGASLSSGGVALGNLAMLELCPTTPPAWRMLPTCDVSPRPLGSPWDVPIVGQSYVVDSTAGPADLADAWLVVGLEPHPLRGDCGLFLPGLGDWRIAGLVGDGILRPSFFTPMGHFQTVARWHVQVPPLPGLAGLDVYMQAIVRDAYTGDFSLTRAFVATLGQ
jgi:hypothetical protein